MKQIYLILLSFFFTISSFAQLNVPSELQAYYNGVDFTKTGGDLYFDLAIKTIEQHSPFLTYAERHDYLYLADEDPNNASNVLLIYNGGSKDKNEYEDVSNPHTPQSFTAEHVYPSSLLGNSNAQGDLHLMRVCDINIDAARGILPFIDGSGKYVSTGSAWFPGDDWRGDVARIIMYANLRYNEPFNDVGSIITFLQWNVDDPVSDIEINRNTIISGAQGSRNPFIDNPLLASYIWGGALAENRWSALSTENNTIESIKIYPNPLQGKHLNISTKESLDVEVYNVIGKTIIKQKVTPTNNQINIEDFNRGVYLIKLSNEFGSITKKLIKR